MDVSMGAGDRHYITMTEFFEDDSVEGLYDPWMKPISLDTLREWHKVAVRGDLNDSVWQFLLNRQQERENRRAKAGAGGSAASSAVGASRAPGARAIKRPVVFKVPHKSEQRLRVAKPSRGSAKQGTGGAAAVGAMEVECFEEPGGDLAAKPGDITVDEMLALLAREAHWLPPSKQRAPGVVKGLVDVLDGAVKSGVKGTSSATAVLHTFGVALSVKQLLLVTQMQAQYYNVWAAEGEGGGEGEGCGGGGGGGGGSRSGQAVDCVDASPGCMTVRDLIDACDRSLTDRIAAEGLGVTLDYALENGATDVSDALDVLTVLTAANVRISPQEMKLAKELAAEYREEWEEVMGGDAGGAGGVGKPVSELRPPPNGSSKPISKLTVGGLLEEVQSMLAAKKDGRWLLCSALELASLRNLLLEDIRDSGGSDEACAQTVLTNVRTQTSPLNQASCRVISMGYGIIERLHNNALRDKDTARRDAKNKDATAARAKAKAKVAGDNTKARVAGGKARAKAKADKAKAAELLAAMEDDAVSTPTTPPTPIPTLSLTQTRRGRSASLRSASFEDDNE